MASITVSNLRPLGSDLFMDSESFMDALTDNELSEINGGATPLITTIATKWFVGAAVAGGIVGAVIYW